MSNVYVKSTGGFWRPKSYVGTNQQLAENFCEAKKHCEWFVPDGGSEIPASTEPIIIYRTPISIYAYSIEKFTENNQLLMHTRANVPWNPCESYGNSCKKSPTWWDPENTQCSCRCNGKIANDGANPWGCVRVGCRDTCCLAAAACKKCEIRHCGSGNLLSVFGNSSSVGSRWRISGYTLWPEDNVKFHQPVNAEVKSLVNKNWQNFQAKFNYKTTSYDAGLTGTAVLHVTIRMTGKFVLQYFKNIKQQKELWNMNPKVMRTKLASFGGSFLAASINGNSLFTPPSEKEYDIFSLGPMIEQLSAEDIRTGTGSAARTTGTKYGTFSETLKFDKRGAMFVLSSSPITLGSNNGTFSCRIVHGKMGAYGLSLMGRIGKATIQ